LALLNTWNRYLSGTSEAKRVVEALATSVAGPVSGLTPLVGEIGTGAVAFSVEPSALGPDVPPPGSVGVRGVLDFVHASVSPRRTATPVTEKTFLRIKCSSNEWTEPEELWLRILAESFRIENTIHEENHHLNSN
jgi:hypothetical protein